jgi:hypothetical protein
MSNWMAECKRAAAVMVCGLQYNPQTKFHEPKSGDWSPAWWEHGLVQQAEREGWSRELRAYVLGRVQHRVMEMTIGSPDLIPAYEDVIRDVDQFMPKDRAWIAAARHEAERTRLANEQRNPVDHEQTERLVKEFRRNPANAGAMLRMILGGKKAEKPRPLPNANRTLFEERHQRKLSDISRRMTGETE